jgi:hypothetical protein
VTRREPGVSQAFLVGAAVGTSRSTATTSTRRVRGRQRSRQIGHRSRHGSSGATRLAFAHPMRHSTHLPPDTGSGSEDQICSSIRSASRRLQAEQRHVSSTSCHFGPLGTGVNASQGKPQRARPPGAPGDGRSLSGVGVEVIDQAPLRDARTLPPAIAGAGPAQPCCSHDVVHDSHPARSSQSAPEDQASNGTGGAAMIA